ncbi:hypothetical protein ACIPUD_11185 [Bradyrhizobium sp. CAR08]
MTGTPIIFSAPMVLALLREADEPGCIDGKTTTRRILAPQPEAYRNEYCTRLKFFTKKGVERGDASPDLTSDGDCPAAMFSPYRVGDRLYVRERLARSTEGFWRYNADGTVIILRSDDPRCASMVSWAHHYQRDYAPSIHMPRWASRITLIVTAVKIEPLQNISEEDGRREGCALYAPGHGWVTRDELSADPGCSNLLSGRLGFQDIWTALHGDESWQANPWVVAPIFRVIKANIDSPEALAA